MTKIPDGVLQFEFFIWDELVQHGFPINREAHACWWYFICAEGMRLNVGKGTDSQIILEGQLWQDKYYENLARTICIQYRLDNPSQFLAYWPQVEQQARRLGLPQPHPEYRKPRNIIH